jgi:hypothetical protein
MPFYSATRISRSISADQTPAAYLRNSTSPAPEDLCNSYWQDGKRMDFASVTDLFFETLEEARAYVQADSEFGCYGLCECYYQYIVIEQRNFANGKDEADWNFQEWYEMPKGDQPYSWNKIEAPLWAKGTVDFGT